MISVPEHFYWGVATAAYQIEGAVNEDGRGESIWDRFCAVPGHILNGDTGAVADDHYHRYQEDIQLMRELGVNAYRFSIAWPRILPTGRGEMNSRGLDFYDRLVDALLAAGIEPCVTLYHWDLPQVLQDQLGGWASRETASAFADYADVVSRHLGDRVRSWMTLNEPWVSAFAGHEHGRMAPGLSDSRLAWQVSHHLLLAHGLAVPVLRANGRADTRVGIVLNQSPMEPATPTEEDEQAARESDGKLNRWFLDPLFRGSYPADVLASLGSLAPRTVEGDASIIASPLDFLGVNYYYRTIVHRQADGSIAMVYPKDAEYTEMNWEVYPAGLRELLLRLHRDYAPPQLIVTENGAAFPDTINDDAQVHDPRRVHYLREHIREALSTLADGVPLAGYFVWSLLDNFEWALGYARRFGIVYIDYPTQRRILKDSGRWYRDMLAGGVKE